MIRALTIRFGVMCAGAIPLVILANVFDAPPALILGTYFAYMGGGALIIGNYCLAHQDEIPARAPQRHDHRN
jgi:hypothetical protein